MLTNFAATSRYRNGAGVPIVVRGPSRRRRRRRPVPLAQPGGVLPQHAGPEDGRAVHGLRRQGTAEGGDSRRRPGAVTSSTSSSTAASRTRCPTTTTSCRSARRRSGREGRDLSIITFGAMVHTALEAARRSRSDGVEAEVIDLRSLAPLDREAILTRWRRPAGRCCCTKRR